MCVLPPCRTSENARAKALCGKQHKGGPEKRTTTPGNGQSTHLPVTNKATTDQPPEVASNLVARAFPGPKDAESERVEGEEARCARARVRACVRIPVGFLSPEPDNPADLALLLLRAGDIETNPGPKKKTIKNRPTRNLLIGDSLVSPVENKAWNIRAVHGGTPKDLREWIQEPGMLNGADNVAILVGGNAVCSKPGKTPPSTPDLTTEDIFGLVEDLRNKGVTSIKVLGVPKRRCNEETTEGPSTSSLKIVFCRRRTSPQSNRSKPSRKDPPQILFVTVRPAVAPTGVPA